MIPLQPIAHVDKAAERRPLSIMFCDLVGSTTLASHWDPEDVREVVGEVARHISEISESFSGFVAEFPGDAALVYFGYPSAHENDAECAIRAALQIVERLSSLVLLRGYRPQVRIGIATGLVVVGATEGTGVAGLRNAAGHTPNLAARLQHLAAPGAVVIDASTYHLAGRLFEYQDLGAVSLKGLSEPVQAWQVLGPATVESRFEAQRGSQLAPLIGRDAEEQSLVSLWREASAGKGRVVLLSGEAGVGKSRLTAALLERLSKERHIRLRYFCSPHLQDSPLHPCIQQLERAAGFARSDGVDRKVERLRQALYTDSGEDLALIAQLLGISNESISIPLTPQQRKERTLDALLRQLDAASKAQPVLMIFEDAHWSDPTSLELLERAVAVVAHRPIMLIVTFRPEIRFSWAHQAHISSYVLQPLSRRESALLVKQIAGSGRLQEDLVEDVVDRTDGVPLYIEEMTKAILEAQDESTQNLMRRVVRQGSSIPPPLHAPLLMRLDRLGAAKQVAEMAAALGREFSYELLAAVSDLTSTELQRAVERLTQSGLLLESRAAPHSTFVFKHALVQDAAYQTMLRTTRLNLHRRVVEVLESQFRETVELQPETLAHHCSQADLLEKAIGYWLKAGYRAMTQWAMAEAVGRLERGLELIERLPPTPERHKLELEYQIARGKALIATKGYAAEVTGAVFTRAHQLCVLLGNPPPVLAVLHGQWTHALLRGDMTTARARAYELLRQGEARADHLWTLMGCRLTGVTSFPLGAFTEGRRQLERGIELFDPARRPVYAAFTVDDPRVVMRTYLAYVLLSLGDVDEARKNCQAALSEARQLAQPYSIAHALIAATYIDLYLGDPHRAEEPLTQLVSLAAEQRIAYYAAFGTLFDGLSHLARGRAERAIDVLTDGIAAYRATSSSLYMPSFMMWLASAHLRARQLERALELIEQSLSLSQQTGMRNDLADIHRVRGEVQLALQDAHAAESSFAMALEVAEEQGAKLSALKAATALAQRLLARGQPVRARQTLAPVHERLAQGHDGAWYREASALLDKL